MNKKTQRSALNQVAPRPSGGAPGFSRRARAAVVVGLLLTLAATGCQVRGVTRREVVKGKLPPEIRIMILVSKLLRGNRRESREAEETLLKSGHEALPWLDSIRIKTKKPEHVDRLVEIMVALYLKDASSPRKKHRNLARDRLVEFDKQHGTVVPLLLLRLEKAGKKLSETIFQVLERRRYISGRWAWPDRAWEELSKSFANDTNILKRYIAFKMENLPDLYTYRMTWNEFDARYPVTVLSDVVIAENYSDLGSIYATLLDRKEPQIRRVAARVVGHLEHAPAASKLVSLLSEKVLSVRIAAAEALGRIKAEEKAIVRLVALLRKGETDKRLTDTICWALGEMRAQKAVSALIQIVNNPAAMDALRKIGNELAVKPLVRVLETSNDPRLKACAAQALGYFRTMEALNALRKAESGVRAAETKAEIVIAKFRIEPTRKNLLAVQNYLTDFQYTLTTMVLLLSKGVKQNVNLSRVMELIEVLPAGRRTEFWKALDRNFEHIPPYHPYGLTSTRKKQVVDIEEWWNENKEGLQWDPSPEMWR